MLDDAGCRFVTADNVGRQCWPVCRETRPCRPIMTTHVSHVYAHLHVRWMTHLFDEADEVWAVSPCDRRLPPTLDAVFVVDLTAAERTAPVQLVGVQLGSKTLD